MQVLLANSLGKGAKSLRNKVGLHLNPNWRFAVCKQAKTSQEIQRMVDDAILIIAYHTDVVIPCPCGSGELLTETDSCTHCMESIGVVGEPFTEQYSDIDMSECDGELELV